MKRSFVLSVAALLACNGVALASLAHEYDQERAERPRRVDISGSGFLGVELSEVTAETVQRLKLKAERGALIEGVTSGSSAAQAGLQKNDVIVKWDGEQIESARELSRHIHETPAGRAVRLSVMRGGAEIEINVTMGDRTALVNRVRIARPAPVARVRVRPEVHVTQRLSDRGHLGVQLQSMTPQLAEYFGLAKRSGALVVFVFADSPASKAGLKAGDVILSAGGEMVDNPMDLRRVLIAKPEGSTEFRILRDKQEMTLTVQLQKGTSSWLLEKDDFGERSVRLSMAPLDIHIPRISISPIVIEAPRVKLAPAVITIPKIKIAPLSIPKIDLGPMKLELEKMKIDVFVVPRRIVL